ncbi:50S ribosomal protein L23 [Candidatus Daviesbacteria bacterium RIFCSPHIGHO2_01_FULL_44_29]|uniref:50S ribosomal protein L23 n=1 Tax=Candidatus Daviesbacteria bacterium RIFCSPHIGHO2_02_FULL_43_12 TaxID=1797776 RepID=A0A1F5KG76_9BACT|nr:MAG: 50S ribosomal protein L23 [Candidatus Daviesbacteria bacterium RIFCSPHIGHO2_01_FULL_44_29]OGE39953.1 MAG: 50S ribosomal protein L23 [Candidatus Daviesbacteria bacterium RIFCSPHIGHO2_02_FULL_43_12]OGE40489.1 MAG: 50S ribosomal protein L23 [Candidatus Daviesbacteria bacterium RIFCSPHIGHO2_12_FULL_47_45]OGE70365.1 MAG: 50S ribosomal protein L23 [Candidatus Daviesbacteria bacterium RIFCSPLOWO2_01_FULL_43_15]
MLKRPIVTEQSMKLSQIGFYTFEVAKTLNKRQIAHIVAKKFGVDVLSVRTISAVGKRRTQRSRKGFYSTDSIKKAIVEVKKGQKIALFEAVAPEEGVVTTADSQVKETKSLLKGTKVKIERGTTAKKVETTAETKETDVN